MYSVLLMAAMSTSPVVPDGILFNRGARASGCTGTEAAGYVQVTRVRRVRGFNPATYVSGQSLDVYSNSCSGGMATGFYSQTYYQPQGFAPMGYVQQSCNGGFGGQSVGANFIPSNFQPQGTVFLMQSPPPRRIVGFRDCGNGQVCAIFG